MTLRTAVVGAGEVSGTHLSGLDRCPLTDAVAVCDVDADRARDAAAEYGVDPFTDYDALLASVDLDWLHLCTPVGTHRDLTIDALEAGVPVLVEKPVTDSVAAFDDLAAAADRTGVPVSVVHNHLFTPAMRRARERIRAGELGDVRAVDLQYAGLTTPDEAKRGAWAFDLPGGEFEEGLPHPIYVALAAGGYPRDADAVCATTSLAGEYDREFAYDGAALQWTTGDGTLCSVSMISDTLPQRRLAVHGTDSSLVVDLVSQSVLPVDRDYAASPVARARANVDRAASLLRATAENARAFADRLLDDDWETARALDGHYYQFHAEARALLDGDAPVVPMAEARWTTELLDRLREAATPGREDGDGEVLPERPD